MDDCGHFVCPLAIFGIACKKPSPMFPFSTPSDFGRAKPEIRMEVPIMGKSYTELRKEFEQEWAKNFKLYIQAGMSQDFIAAMREFDEEVFRKERSFQDNTPARIEYWDDPRLDNPVEYFSRLRNDLDTQLENLSPELSHKVSTREKEILLLASIGFTQEEIAVKLHITQSTVSYHLNKLKKLLK